MKRKMFSSTVSPEDFVKSAKDFCKISQKCLDTWKLFEDNNETHKSYLAKNEYITSQEESLYKAEYVIFYNLSYGVPSFSFNIWNSEGRLLNLEQIRDILIIKTLKTTIITFRGRQKGCRLFLADIRIQGMRKRFEKDFYSVVTQQEHPIFNRPYFIIHPCHTESLLAAFKNRSKNILITFLSLITPIINLDLPLEYGI